MSELKTFLENHKLDHKVKVFTLKDNTRLVRLAFETYDMMDYEYQGYNSLMNPEKKKLFPENASSVDAIIISNYDKAAIETIAQLAEQDPAVIQYEKQIDDETEEMLKSFV